MSTLESTVSMLEALPEDDLKAINGIVKQFYIKLDNSQYTPIDKDEMIASLKVAQQHAEEGPNINGHDFANQMREKYGL